jgi:hypothetical protein
MKIIELILDEAQMLSGIDAISIVSQPAIESDFVALKEHPKEIALKAIDEDKRILLGAALIPNKMIFRKDGEDEYYVYFSKETIRKASELYLTAGRQNKSTLEHEVELQGLSVVESWIKEDGEKDKSNLYGIEAPIGTWFVSMKVNNEDVWTNFVKTGKVKGFSIEGYFSQKANLTKHEEPSEADALLETIRAIIRENQTT